MDHELFCLRCRTSGHRIDRCPLWQRQDDKVVARSAEEFFLRGLQQKAEHLCETCEKYDILNYISTAEVDDYASKKAYVAGLSGIDEYVKRPSLQLGTLESISLRTDCPLCRILFRIFPDVTNESARDTVYFLSALPSYERQPNPLKKVDGTIKARYARYFSIENEEKMAAVSLDHDIRSAFVWRQFRAFGLSSKNPLPDRDAMNARLISPLVDFNVIKPWLDKCESTHGPKCQPIWVKELETTSMVDVQARKVVPCPPNCRYVALSYVWGGVMAPLEALENGTLPQTIEDAMTIATKLGFRYLWVDMLCVDQTGSPQQAQQIAIMDRIYQGASMTILASADEHANTGIPGVRDVYPRNPQGVEIINDMEILVLPPTAQHEAPTSRYRWRAWTLQEGALSRRRLAFTKHETHFGCNHVNRNETVDDSSDPGEYFVLYDTDDQDTWLMDLHKVREMCPPEQSIDIALGIWRNALQDYTQRQMTNDFDSLNAFVGLQNYLSQSLFTNEFIWGLPLRNFPQSLRWFHSRKCIPKRRPQFPSWSWAGWEGTAIYSDHINLLSADKSELSDKSVDMKPNFVSIDDQTLNLEAHLVQIDIRTEPFSEAFVPGTDTLLGRVKERDFMHSNTLPSGVYEFLVVERFHYRPHYRVLPGNNRRRCEIYLLLLDPEGDKFTRRTKVRLWLEPDVDIALAKPRFGPVKLV